jgi:simple sugar transport system ATP-binding protein
MLLAYLKVTDVSKSHSGMLANNQVSLTIQPGEIQLSDYCGLSVEPNRPIHSLSVGERQRVESIRCLSQTTKLLILDEPTAVLTPQETEKLFATLRQLAADGCSILFSSHKLQEVRSLCDSATGLRNGKVVARCNPQLERSASLARMMIGSDVPASKERRNQPVGIVCLLVNDLSLQPDHPFGTTLQYISFEVYAGEIDLLINSRLRFK